MTWLRRWFGLRCLAMCCPHRSKSGALYVIECADCGRTQYVGP
jgi:hypothetical protein